MKCVVKNNSSMDMGPLLPLLKSLLPYSRKKLGFNRPPSLFFASDTENAAKPLGKTAFYDPAETSITVFVDGRHPKDILRSISHELVHHMQHERGDFGTNMDTGEGYAQKNDALRELEREAYESGNMCFRDWEDENRQALQEAKQHFDRKNKKMSANDKRNDKIESLLMEKWGFKAKVSDVGLIQEESAEDRKTARSKYDLSSDVGIAAAINQEILQFYAGSETLMTAPDIKEYDRKERRRVIREIGNALRAGRERGDEKYEELWSDLLDNRSLFQYPVAREIALRGAKDSMFAGVEKIIDNEKIDNNTAFNWILRGRVNSGDPQLGEQPIINGSSMMRALENSNDPTYAGEIENITKRTNDAKDNLKDYAKFKANLELANYNLGIETKYDPGNKKSIGVSAKRQRATPEEAGYEYGMAIWPTETQSALEGWEAASEKLEVDLMSIEDGKPVYTPEQKIEKRKEAFSLYAKENPAIYKPIKRDYAAPLVDLGRGGVMSKIGRFFRTGDWWDKPIGIRSAEEQIVSLRNAYDKLSNGGEKDIGIAFEDFVLKYNEKVKNSISGEGNLNSEVARANEFAKNITKGHEYIHGLEPIVLGSETESLPTEPEGGANARSRMLFLQVLADNKKLWPPNIGSRGSEKYLKSLESEWAAENSKGSGAINVNDFVSKRTTDDFISKRNNEIGNFNNQAAVNDVVSDFQLSDDFSKQPDLQNEDLIRKVVQEALKRKFGE